MQDFLYNDVLESHHSSKMKLKNIFTAKKSLKEWLRELARQRTSPLEIAFGFSLGVLIGILPSPGVNIALALAVIALFKVNKLSTMAGVALTANPLATAGILLASFRIGAWITAATDINLKTISISAWTSYFKILIIGNLILSFTAGILSFVIVYFIVKRVQYKRLEKEVLDEALFNHEKMDLEKAMRRE